jgi:hypothetical protein
MPKCPHCRKPIEITAGQKCQKCCVYPENIFRVDVGGVENLLCLTCASILIAQDDTAQPIVSGPSEIKAGVY